jgi:TolB protein
MFERRRERSRARLGAIAIAITLILLMFLGAPRVINVQPVAGSTMVPSTAQIRLKFNQPMDKVSVETRLKIEPPMSGRYEWQGNTLSFVPDSRWAQGEIITIQLTAGARSSYFLPILRRKSWSFEIGVPRILYLDPSEKQSFLYIRTPEFLEPRVLTEAQTEILDFSVSVDGTMVVYSTLNEDSGSSLYWIDLISEEERLILECRSPRRCQNPHLSPNNDWVIFEQVELQAGVGGKWIAGSPQLFIMNLEAGSQPIPIAKATRVNSNPSWSSQGTLSYYDSTQQEIVIMDLNIPITPNELNRVPSALEVVGNWSPDGEFLLFPNVVILDETYEKAEDTGYEFSQFYSHIFRLSMSNGFVTDLSGEEFGLVEDASPAYSPDARWIAFTRKFLDGSRWTLGRQLWLMRSDGTQARQITQDEKYRHFSISWSPDSNWLAFVRADQDNLASPPEIWLYDLENDKLSFLESGGYLPHWLP